MNFILAPDDQPLKPFEFVDYSDESDLNGGLTRSPLSIPTNMPIEGWPSETDTNLTLQQWQQDINNQGGDRHSIVVQPGTGKSGKRGRRN